MGHEYTTKEQAQSVRTDGAPQPGIVVAFTASRPNYRAVPMKDAPVIAGRRSTETPGDERIMLDDEHTSREHVEVRLAGGQWWARDLGSRNGTYVDGKRERIGAAPQPAQRTIRIGESVLLLERDITRFFMPHSLLDEKLIAGPLLQESLDLLAQFAKDGLHVLITGETGSGKELAAQAFHQRGPRPNGPFRALNTAAVAPDLWEAELFGYRKGAFAGAHMDHPGLFEAAQGGTLFLDEIGEIPLEVQAKLLRVLQEGEIRRIGENTTRPLNVRIVAATNRDLRARVAAGRFRDDLYYRLAQNMVHLPPLRERPEEIPFLIALMLRDAPLPVDASLVEQCLLRPWQGNVRELLGAARRAGSAAVAAKSRRISASYLEPEAGQWIAPTQTSNDHLPSSPPADRQLSRDEKEEAVLAEFRRDPRVRAEDIADKLGLGRATVYRYLKKHGLMRDAK